MACECKPDIEWLIALHLSPAEAPVTLVPIEVGEGKAVAHPPDATWRTTHKSLLNTGGPVVLTVKTTE